MVGERLAELREQKALTLHELEELSGVGADSISKIENGHRKPRPSTLRKMARALGVEVEDFFPKAEAAPRLEDRQRTADIEVGEAFFVPLEEGEEEDTVTLRVYYVRLFEGDEPILKAMREASPEEAAEMRRQREMAVRSRE